MRGGPGLLALTLVALTCPVSGGTATAAPLPERQVTVTGVDVSTYPTFSEGVTRYGVITTADTAGTLTVTATSTDPDAAVVIDGRSASPGTPVDVTGLESGDEVNVQIVDSGGVLNQSWVYLPAGFPEPEVTRDDPGQQPGSVFVGLSTFTSTATYEAVLDKNAVPSYVRAGGGTDIKALDGMPGYAMAVGNTIQRLDPSFAVVDTLQLDGTPSATDFHDSILLPDGGAVLMGYAPSSRNGDTWVDAVIQIVDADGEATFEWNSKDHVDPTEAFVSPRGDYAHINSLELLPNGDILASFRNLSQVMRIATVAHDGYEPGDVVWRLGGATNQFTFVDDPDGGPCAQHYARILPNGHLLLFDNGSLDQRDENGLDGLGGQTSDMCPDPAAPLGPRIARPQSRVAEYALDESTHTATLVWSYQVPNRYAPFAGNAQRLANGNTMIGWSLATDQANLWNPQPVASEVTADGTEVWAMHIPGWFGYRVQKYDAPDAQLPSIAVTSPPSGATFDEDAVVDPDFGCADRGGSNLVDCVAVEPGPIDTSTPGPHVWRATATDGAGNRRTVSVPYAVRPLHQPDVQVRRPGHRWIGDGVHGPPRTQKLRIEARPRAERTVQVRIVNDGLRAGRATLNARPRRGVSYLVGGRDVSARIHAGTFRTPLLEPGQAWRLKVRLSLPDAGRPAVRAKVSVTSAADSSRTDGATIELVRR